MAKGKGVVQGLGAEGSDKGEGAKGWGGGLGQGGGARAWAKGGHWFGGKSLWIFLISPRNILKGIL